MKCEPGLTWRGHVVGTVVAVFVSGAGTTVADTHCVPEDYAGINEALLAAEDGDEICVAPGTYHESIDFIGKAVRLYSTGGPEVTVIDGAGGPVVTCGSGEGPETILDGFTITGGAASHAGGMYNFGSSPTVTNCTFHGNTAGGSGGGMRNYDGSSPTVTNCTFIGNTAGGGGGGMGNSTGSSPTVTNCTFSGNTGGGGGGMSNSIDSSPKVTSCTFSANAGDSLFSFGGGMRNGIRSSPTVTDCTFSGNEASLGGGMFSFNGSHPTVTGCTFTGNEALNGGGGMMIGDFSSPTVTNCTFAENVAHTGGGIYTSWDGHALVTGCSFRGNTAAYGGGLHNHRSEPLVVNCLFIGNVAEGGGGMRSWQSSPVLINCTLIENVSTGSTGAGIRSEESQVQVTNCILWNPAGQEIFNVDALSGATVTYSDVEGGHAGVGNIDADPLCDADGRPQAGSPCIDAGANNAVPADVPDLDDDGCTAERLPLDLDGHPRFAADENDYDPGCGVPVVVDMGAYEYQLDPVHPILVGDVDGDGEVALGDLSGVLSTWGACASDCCLADVDFDWEVGFADLLIVLSSWGPCP